MPKAEIGGLRAKASPDLPARAAAGIAMMAIALGAAWFGGFPFLAFWWIAGVLTIWEWHRLIGGERLWPRVALGAFALLAAASEALRNQPAGACVALAAGAVATAAAAGPSRRVWAGAGVVYAGAMVAGVNLLRASPHFGFAAIIWVFAVVWGTDIAAYFGGRLIGGRKLWPSVSPGKTWSGAIAGAAAAALLGVAVAAPEGARFLPTAMLGLIVSVFSQGGDLFESAMKRRAGVKDSSRLIPGHGGVMDRLDGFIVAAAVAAILAGVKSSGSWIAEGLFQW
jgi:phosphatidate cytidylyltransferase